MIKKHYIFILKVTSKEEKKYHHDNLTIKATQLLYLWLSKLNSEF